MYKIRTKNQDLIVSKPAQSVAESVNTEQAEFIFDSTWVGLTVYACFKNSSIEEEYHIPLVDTFIVTIPWEVLSKPGTMYIGVLGLDGNTIVKPTVWAPVSNVVAGVSPNGIGGQEPTETLVQQLTALTQEAVDTANSVRRDADEGKFDGKTPIMSIEGGRLYATYE